MASECLDHNTSTYKKLIILMIMPRLQVECGHVHTLAVTTSGRLFGWGHNAGGSQLNTEDALPHATELYMGGKMLVKIQKTHSMYCWRCFSITETNMAHLRQGFVDVKTDFKKSHYLKTTTSSLVPRNIKTLRTLCFSKVAMKLPNIEYQPYLLST